MDIRSNSFNFSIGNLEVNDPIDCLVERPTFKSESSTLTYLGLNASYPTTTTPVNRKATFSEAVADIQAALTAASITDVSILVVGNQIKITSTASSLSLGELVPIPMLPPLK